MNLGALGALRPHLQLAPRQRNFLFSVHRTFLFVRNNSRGEKLI